MGAESASEFLANQSSYLVDLMHHYLGAAWQILSAGAERHGSWEWVAYSRDSDLDRYLTFALTPQGAPELRDDNEPWVAEVSGVVEDDAQRFTQFLIRRATVSRSDAMTLVSSWHRRQ